MLMTSRVLDGRGALLVLDRPAALNALNAPLLDALDRALDAAEADEGVRIVLLTGGAKVFSVGGDLKEDHADADDRVRRMHALALRLQTFPKITIAAIEGWALGGGLEIAMGCTFRVAAPGARLGVPEVKLGLIPGFGGTQLLPRLVGAARATEMLCDGEPVDAAEALAIGLVNRLADAPGEALMCAEAFARRFLDKSSTAQRAARACVYEGAGLPFRAALEVERREVNALRSGLATPQGILAFRKRRAEGSEASHRDDQAIRTVQNGQD